jgi:hypothetical protein
LGYAPHQIIASEAGFYPALGLLYIAGYLEKYASCEVEILDSVTEELNYKELKSRIEESKPDIVGIYFGTFYLYDSILTA